jgi:hypothetical protein
MIGLKIFSQERFLKEKKMEKINLCETCLRADRDCPIYPDQDIVSNCEGYIPKEEEKDGNKNLQ